MKLNDLSTNQLAAYIHCKSASIRVRYCRTGSFHGIIPSKLPTGRLLWPGDSVERLKEKGRGMA